MPGKPAYEVPDSIAQLPAPAWAVRRRMMLIEDDDRKHLLSATIKILRVRDSLVRQVSDREAKSILDRVDSTIPALQQFEARQTW